MRKLGVLGLAAGLAVGLAAQGGRADDNQEEQKPPSRSLWQRMFGKEPAPEEKPTDPGEDSKKTAEDAKAREKRLRQEALGAYEDCMRRLAVCDRLREIANQTGNARLDHQAEELDRRAWELYRKKTAHLKSLAGPVQDEPGDPDSAPPKGKEGKP